MADFDEEMQRALELSAQEHMATCTQLVLDGELRVMRRDLERPLSQHWKSPYQAQDGVMLQVDTVNQFAHHWAPLVREFSSPSSTCGYMVMANALALQKLLPEADAWKQTQFHEFVRLLRDHALLEPLLREAMEVIAQSRRAWVANHAADFPTDASRNNYLSAWVANYEISDFLQAKASRACLDCHPVHFVRYNQWPQYRTATHEERARLVEEERFGGSSDADGRVNYREGDSVFIVESFRPERRLESPEEFLQGHPPCRAPGVFVADLNGHFVTCVAVHLETPSGEEKPTLIVVNTTGTRYLDNLTCAFIFDLCFPPTPAETSEPGDVRHPLVASDEASGPSPEAISRLTAMGFAEDNVRNALTSTGGNIEVALEMLLG